YLPYTARADVSYSISERNKERRLYMRHHHRPHCGCGCHKPVKQCVYPVKENVVHNCTEETVQHVHPSHTTVKNHHIIKNEHVYPHSTSVENSTECVDINCGGKCGNPEHARPRPGHHHAGTHHNKHHGMNHWNKHKNKWW